MNVSITIIIAVVCFGLGWLFGYRAGLGAIKDALADCQKRANELLVKLNRSGKDW